MSAYYEFVFLESFIRREVAGSMTPWEMDDDTMIAFPDEAINALDHILEPYNSNESLLSRSLEITLRQLNRQPWAIIVFDREYPLAGYFTSIRPNPQTMPFFPFTKAPHPIPDDFVPRVGGILVMGKDAIPEIAVVGSPLIAEAWNMLKARPADKQWLCLPDPLPESWVEETSRDDNERYLAYRRQ
jgi:hypothetical protein